VILAAALAPSGAARAQGLAKLRISEDFRLYGPNAPFLLAQESGLFREAGIDATIDGSTGSGEAINRVASGTYDMAYADISTLEEFWSRNPNVAPKLVMVILDRSPQSIVSLKKAGIKTIADLAGHSVGTGQSDATARMFPGILRVNNIPLDAVKRLPLDPRLRNGMLLRGDIDAVIGFDFAILFDLMTQNVQPKDTDVIYYADNGFDFYGNGLIVSRTLIEKDPDLVRRATRAVAKAWIASIADPGKAIAALAKRDALTAVPLETERLKWVLERDVVTPATRAGGLGAIDPQKLERGLKTVAEGFELAVTPAVSDIYDDRFLPSVEDRRLPSK
jgi:NitT/TauT family transport system substrate-binding protein